MGKKKTSDERRARALQKATGIAYVTCLKFIREEAKKTASTWKEQVPFDLAQAQRHFRLGQDPGTALMSGLIGEAAD